MLVMGISKGKGTTGAMMEWFLSSFTRAWAGHKNGGRAKFIDLSKDSDVISHNRLLTI